MKSLHATYRLTSTLAVALLAATALLHVSCTGASVRSASGKPNVLWIIWDTVRADRLSVYGHVRPTTPYLEQWANSARVFENVISTAGSTVPSHASMFTGLLPTEHGAFHTQRRLDSSYTTIAELLQHDGYRTYLFAANPHLQEKQGFHQGFDVHEHPWSDRYREEALRIVREKVSPEDRSSNLPLQVKREDAKPWNIKAAGELAQRGLLGWLGDSEQDRPFFAFLNYMEAHTPYIPTRSHRERMMTPEQADSSYNIDNSYPSRWAYTFGLKEYEPGQLELMGLVYDATLTELDDLFRDLMTELERGGYLDDTIVILAADHGEHLGEHHMLDHQYALYEQLLRVPLLVRYPPRFAPGRDRSPVVTFDIFPTLLEITGVDPPAGQGSQAVSLLAGPESRRRLAEYPAVFEPALKTVGALYPTFDPEPWKRKFRALYLDDHKLICSTDGRHELYDLPGDPGEKTDLYAANGELAEELMRDLLDVTVNLLRAGEPGEAPEHSEEERKMLEALGYLGGGDADQEETEFDFAAAGCGF